MPERGNPVDKPPSHERIVFQEGLVGLQARLLIGGEALNPDKLDLAPVTRESLGNFENRNYRIFESASTRERTDYWKGKENDNFNQQKKQWVNDLVELFKKNKAFFRDEDEGKQWHNLFSKLGFDTQSFSDNSAGSLYDKYFSSGNQDKSVKKFVSDVVTAYKKPDGTIYEQLKQNLNGIQWLANIFGNVSSEVISQLIDAEVKLQTAPDSLIKPANETTDDTLRVNNLLPKEKDLLTFLWGGSLPTQAEELKVEWKYERPKEPREFPQKFSWLEQAELLKKSFPQKYGHLSDETLAIQMENENKSLQKRLTEYGLSAQDIHNLTFEDIEKEILSHYRQFIHNRYAITLPTTEKINVIPINGMMSELYNPKGRALAFVTGLTPYIFLDVKTIANAALRLTKKNLYDLSPRELGNLVKRLLREIKPHEYTHLMSDIAYWNLREVDDKGNPLKDKDPILSRFGKLGLTVVKPRNEHRYIERGRGLMEAVTVELTQEWAHSENKKLDIPAYAGERQILYELQNLLLREEGMHQQESFKKFVHGYFKPEGYKKLVETIDGHTKVNGKMTTKRPHLTSIVYGLMEYEARKRGGTGAAIYPLTYYYLQKRLPLQFKQEILVNLDQMYLTPVVKEELRRQLT